MDLTVPVRKDRTIPYRHMFSAGCLNSSLTLIPSLPIHCRTLAPVGLGAFPQSLQQLRLHEDEYAGPESTSLFFRLSGEILTAKVDR